MKQLFPGIFVDGKRLFTLNLTPGIKFFDEDTVIVGNREYRQWDARRSKLAAAIMNGLKTVPLRQDSVVLYLGASHGYTSSFVSDICKDGFVFALDFAPRVVRELVFVCEKRKNMAPILADANRPEEYKDKVAMADVVYQDVAQRNQVEIFVKNMRQFLKPGGYGMVAIKARSIDVTKNPKAVFWQVKDELQKELKIVEERNLLPFQKDHTFFVCKV